MDKKQMQKWAEKAGLLLVAMVLVGGNAHALNTFGVDLAAITTDLTTVGTLVMALVVFYAGFKWVRRMVR